MAHKVNKKAETNREKRKGEVNYSLTGQDTEQQRTQLLTAEDEIGQGRGEN